MVENCMLLAEIMFKNCMLSVEEDEEGNCSSAITSSSGNNSEENDDIIQNRSSSGHHHDDDEDDEEGAAYAKQQTQEQQSTTISLKTENDDNIAMAADASTTKQQQTNSDDNNKINGGTFQDIPNNNTFQQQQTNDLTTTHNIFTINENDIIDEDDVEAYLMKDMKPAASNKDDDDDDEFEGIEIPILNSDTFSFLAFVEFRSVSMVLSVSVIFVQLATVSILMIDILGNGTANNGLGVPAVVPPTTSAMQVLALLITVVSQGDLQDSLNTFFIGYHKLDLEKNLGRTTPHWRWVASGLTRFVVASFALVTTFMLIVGQSSPRDLLLDFTAIAFVTNLDNITFELASLGYFGLEAQLDASAIILAKTRTLMVIRTVEDDEEDINSNRKSSSRIDNPRGKSFSSKKSNSSDFDRPPLTRSGNCKKTRSGDFNKRKSKLYKLATNETTRYSFFPPNNDEQQQQQRIQSIADGLSPTAVASIFKPRKFPRTSILALMYVALMIPWAYIYYKQRSGYYLCQTLFVQFSDEFSPDLATFSGLYEIQQPISGDRRTYRGAFNIGEAIIGYCGAETAWVFSHGENNNDDPVDVCNWKARSIEIHPLTEQSYDVMSTAHQEWSVLDNRGWAVPLPYFSMQCYDCRYDENFCGGPERGTCVDNRCVCNDGWNGIRCEFPTYCDNVEVDIRTPPFKGNREWSRRYDLLTSSQEDDGKAVELYNHPVYISDGEPFDVMFYNGRRWVVATSGVNDLFQRGTIAETLTNNFHGYWSNYTVGFLSVHVDLNSPESGLATPDGLQWFPALKQSAASETQAPDFTRPLETILLCTTCSTETNPCKFKGICGEDGTCSCTSGSSGSLCQVAPDGNGLCNKFFNTPEFGYDGGDCCEATCTSTPEYSCGSKEIESSGVSAFGFVGFPNCEDPRFKFQISGSKTLFDIVDRERLRCGMTVKTALVDEVEGGGYSGFEVDLCKAVAAAVLGDPQLHEIVITDSKSRFSDLLDEKYDLLIRTTTYNAERDVYLGSANSGFTFASIPYFYDGLRYAGLPQYTACADKLDFSSAECLDLKICIAEPTSWYTVTRDLFPDSILVALNSFGDSITFFEEGLCNVIAGETFDVLESSVRKKGYTGAEYAIGTNVFSKEPLAAVTRQGDRVWSKFVSWMFDALVQAEEFNITKSTAASLAPTELFGDEFRSMFQNAVQAVGNYGEIYERNLERYLPRGGLNRVNNGTTGLIYSFPFGNFDKLGPDPSPGGTIAAIRNRGYLTCGISPQPGFAAFDALTSTWNGFDADLCRGIAAAIFNGNPRVQFAPSPFRQRFPSLSSGSVDLLAAATTHTLERAVKERFTSKSYDFSPSYHYTGLGFAGPEPWGRCADELVFQGTTDDDCSGTKICVAEGTTYLDAMRGPLAVPEANMVIVTNQELAYDKLISGECNVIAGETSAISLTTVVNKGFDLSTENGEIEYYVGSKRYTEDPLAIVTRSDDAQFSDFVRWILLGFFYAAEQGITRDSSFRMPITHLFGESLNNMWIHSVTAVGSFAEMFDKNFEGLTERTGMNLLNQQGSPQLYAKPGVLKQ